MKLAVGYPWDSAFIFTCFVEAALNMKAPPDCEVKWFRGEGWASSRRHIDILEKSLSWGADMICFVGPDQIHPKDLLPKLMGRINEGYEVISAMVPMRGHVKDQGSKPFQAMAWRLSEENKKYIPICPEDGDVQPIDVIGSGVLMFPADLIRKMKKPWLLDDIDKESWKRKGPCDSLFVRRLKTECGAQVYVDTTIEIKHANVFEIDKTYSDRFSDWGQVNV